MLAIGWCQITSEVTSIVLVYKLTSITGSVAADEDAGVLSKTLSSSKHSLKNELKNHFLALPVLNFMLRA